VLQVRVRVSRLQKLSFIRDAGWIDFIVADIKPVEVGRDMRDYFISLRFHSDGNVVSGDCSIVLNRKFHKRLTSFSDSQIYQSAIGPHEFRGGYLWGLSC